MRNVTDTLRYILKRLLLMIFTFLVIFVICFVLVRMLPPNIGTPGPGKDTDMAYNNLIISGRGHMVVVNGERVYQDYPIIQQLFNYVKNVFFPLVDPETGKTLSRFGYSYVIEATSTPDGLLVSRFPPTIMVNVFSSLLSVPLGIALGIFMALKKNKWQDNVLSVVVMLLISVPSFVDAFLLQFVFGYELQWLDPRVLSVTDPRVGGNWFSPVMLRSLVLPVISMSLGSICGYARYTRAELTEVLTSDFMLLARTKGLTRGQATVRHALRNSMVPIFPMILGEVLAVLSGSMIIEKIYGINGVGDLLITSITGRDYDVYIFVSMFYILIGLVGGLIVDISYGLVDPRIRMGGGK